LFLYAVCVSSIGLHQCVLLCWRPCAEDARSCGRRSSCDSVAEAVDGGVVGASITERHLPYGSTTSSVVCAGCRRPIHDQYMLHVQPGLDWHASCLRCAECCQALDENCTCYMRDGHPYCKPDYNRSEELVPSLFV